jgi:hypothetical protein
MAVDNTFFAVHIPDVKGFAPAGNEVQSGILEEARFAGGDVFAERSNGPLAGLRAY